MGPALSSDVRGVASKALYGHGNDNLGLREQRVVPEIYLDQLDRLRWLEVCIVTTARTDAEGRSHLTGLGMPFRKN